MNITEKYRPKTLDEVIGQPSVTKSIGKLLKDKSHSTFLLEGPSGVGKTSIARICVSLLGCLDVREIDAASNSGVDDARVLVNAQEYVPLGGRAFIIDECQRLSKNAWDALLKAVENPPPNNYWFFCTTELSKVPRTVQTRCATYRLNTVSASLITDLLHRVNDEEKLGIDKDYLVKIAESVQGSPREALVKLQQSIGLTEEEIQTLIAQDSGIPLAFDFAKSISKSSFEIEEVMKLLALLKDESPESIRQVTRAYFTTFVLRSPSNRYALGVLNEFETPSLEQNRITDIVLRVARINKWK